MNTYLCLKLSCNNRISPPAERGWWLHLYKPLPSSCAGHWAALPHKVIFCRESLHSSGRPRSHTKKELIVWKVPEQSQFINCPETTRAQHEHKCTGVEQILTQGENQPSGEWNFFYIWQNVYRENTMESEKNSKYRMYFPSTCAKSSKNFDYLLHRCLSHIQDLWQA